MAKVRYCNRCKGEHAKPWDAKCNIVLVSDAEDSSQNEGTGEVSENQNVAAQVASPKENANASKDPPTFELISTLLTTIKTLDSKMSTYDEKLAKVSASVLEALARDQPAVAGASNGAQSSKDSNIEPKFAENIDGTKPKIRHSSKSGQQKHRKEHMATEVPPPKIVKVSVHQPTSNAQGPETKDLTNFVPPNLLPANAQGHKISHIHNVSRPHTVAQQPQNSVKNQGHPVEQVVITSAIQPREAQGTEVIHVGNTQAQDTQWYATLHDSWGDANATQGNRGAHNAFTHTTQSLVTPTTDQQQAWAGANVRGTVGVVQTPTQQAPQVQWQATAGAQAAQPSILDVQTPGVQMNCANATQQVQDLRTDPMIQAVVAERVNVAAQAAGKQRTSGRINTQYNAEPDPTKRWPNEVFNVGSDNKKRPTFDNLTSGQFIWGFVKNVREVQDIETKNRMLEELGNIVKLSETGGWDVARDAFAEMMHKIEDGELTWGDRTELMHLRIDTTVSATQSAVRASGQTMNLNRNKVKFQNQQKNKPYRLTRTVGRDLPCRHFNWEYCRQTPPHKDKLSGKTFIHVCETCDKHGSYREDHTARQCTEFPRA